MPEVRAAQARIARARDHDPRRPAPRRHRTRRSAPSCNIGIGGSDLGPLPGLRRAGARCRPPATVRPGVRVRRPTSIPQHLARALRAARPATTLFVVTSKTFTTQETLANAGGARGLARRGAAAGADVGRALRRRDRQRRGRARVRHRDADVLPMWDWVGGRYSLWSAVGLPIAHHAGAGRASPSSWPARASVDEHFRSAPLERNLPVLLGLVGWWNARYLGHPERVVVPYAQALVLLPAYLQQLVLESNGKRVAPRRRPVAGPAVRAALWGDDGHQRRSTRSSSGCTRGRAKRRSSSSCRSRAAHPLGARSRRCSSPTRSRRRRRCSPGATADALRAELAGKGLAGPALDAAIAARVCPGNRASTTILLPRARCHGAGQLLALYEHRTFVEAVLVRHQPASTSSASSSARRSPARSSPRWPTAPPLPDGHRRVDARTRRAGARGCAAPAERGPATRRATRARQPLPRAALSATASSNTAAA